MVMVVEMVVRTTADGVMVMVVMNSRSSTFGVSVLVVPCDRVCMCIDCEGSEGIGNECQGVRH